MFYIFLFYYLMLSFSCAQDPVANLRQGRIIGIKVFTESTLTPIEVYYGIPYAIPPIGRHRFLAPVRHTGWERTFFARRIPPHCPCEEDPDNDNASEDCLFLNVWTPRPTEGVALPVVVLLYSESWTRGGTTLPCQELAGEGVVVVTVSYRLHLLAFFTLKSKSARGNLALLDQYLALVWIRDNIAAFGGNPATITLLGHSAGADSILYHLVSPRSTGLFHRAILMSPQYIWQTIDEKSTNNQTYRISQEIVRVLGCNDNGESDIINCLQTRPLSDIIALYPNKTWSKYLHPIPDDFLPDSEQFLPVSLVTALSQAKRKQKPIDLLLGTNDIDALNYNDETYAELNNLSPLHISKIADSRIIPKLLQMLSLGAAEDFPVLVKAIRWEYWNDVPQRLTNINEAIEKVAKLETSAKWDAGGALLAARIARIAARLYVYRYSQPGGVDLYGRYMNFSGATHGTNLVSLLGNPMIMQIARRLATADEKQISSLFRKIIINFIKHGYPVEDGKWRQYMVGDAHIYIISNGKYYKSYNNDVEFWLKYLPELSNLISKPDQTEQLALEQEESRLRGGVLAMCGVAVFLLLLLSVSAILLRRQHSRRYSVSDETLNS
ncbi:carboxylesterase 1C isoform X1 [Bombyx mori]|uniref:Carboxylic ester hydrolase n=1 Tax=Bombyx mori TaxID=7091 RepID=A0A8R2DMZ7_BOMMO|nr:carboxylesterase 1C isoform X1 [Bombyx mori]